MKQARLPTVGPAFVLAAVCSIFSWGCGRSADGPSDAPTPSEQAASSLPVVHESLDEIRDRMTALVQVQPDQRRVISSEAEFDQWRLKALIVLDEVRRREGVEGCQQKPVEKTRSQHAVVDASGKIASRAWCCWNPECLGKGKGGGPLIFPHQWDNASVGADGNVFFRTRTEEEMKETRAILCPACGLVEFVRPYNLPEVELRHQWLSQELIEARRIRAEIDAAGHLVPANIRTPTEIMQDINELPKLFVTPESGG